MLNHKQICEYIRAISGGLSVNELPEHILDIHLRSGLAAAMDALGYSKETDPHSFALVADQYEYPLPQDAHQITWAYWNGQPLTLGSTEDWVRQQRDWRGATSGTPAELAVDGRTLLLFPPPDADAIEEDGFVTYRFLRQFRLTPAGIPGMPDADVYVAAQLAALEWMGANNADGRHNNRIASVNAQVAPRIRDAGTRSQQPLQDHYDVIPAFSTIPFHR